jgi:exodeoxyribonuclease VII large subunit
MSLFELTFPPSRPVTEADRSGPAPVSEPPRVWSVKTLVSAVTRHIEQQFADVRVEGEISNCRSAPSGHLYFTLKDGDAQLACVMFRSRASLLKFRVEDGLQVVARGRITVYEGRGQMQLMADSLEPLGDGAFRVAYEKLRERLQQEGLFDAERKKPMPAFAARIGLITSPTGAVVRDILNILERRHNGMNVLIYPATVQGSTAAAEFRAGLQWFKSQPTPVDVIILARGGGSLEDLQCFNDEALARDIASCAIPTISAIGHETDFTIADFVADLRAPTPSAAAEIITAQHFRVEERVIELDRRIERAFRYRVAMAREEFQRLLRSPALENARDLAARRQQGLDELCERLAAAQRGVTMQFRERLQTLHDRMVRLGLDRRLGAAVARHEALTMRLGTAAQTRMQAARNRLRPLEAQLAALSPVSILQRGYALVYAEDGTLLRNAAHVSVGAMLTTQLAAGQLESRVTRTNIQKEADKDA